MQIMCDGQSAHSSVWLTYLLRWNSFPTCDPGITESETTQLEVTLVTLFFTAADRRLLTHLVRCIYLNYFEPPS